MSGAVHSDGGWIPLDAVDMRRLSQWYQKRKVVFLPWGGNTRLRTKTYYDERVGVYPYRAACVAFQGKMGGPCRCTIYRKRPKICREFRPGSYYCLEARRDEGIQ